MAHGRSYSAPTVTPRAAKRNGMVFTRPFSWSAYLELLPTDSTPAGSSNPSISFQPGNSLHLYTSPPADWSSSSSGSSSCSKPDLWCSGLEPGESGRSHSTVGSGSSTSQAVITPELSPKTDRPSLSDLDLVCRTPFLELALSPDLVIRPVRPCERCALHAKECWYEPRTLLPAVEGDTLALPKCACCPDDDGCWHVLGGQMVRPRVAVLDAPQDAMDAMDAAWAV
ncbi:hypothetical protein CspeluHIS016_0300060 [Cutaneotrichosporon spelunceum]|uniref:Uncharacterized protein n=1 Tax=Cutaneotrichosporon spelunceum TaxID=1672016 RepID=A0AAD3YAN7_9TREE|nr:hypothetical protein CspeluHIS016_0300060 [Cutaneotrichosporon spelunceum]